MDPFITLCVSVPVLLVLYIAWQAQLRGSIRADAVRIDVVWSEHEHRLLALAIDKHPRNEPCCWEHVATIVGRSAADCEKQARLVVRSQRRPQTLPAEQLKAGKAALMLAPFATAAPLQATPLPAAHQLVPPLPTGIPVALNRLNLTSAASLLSSMKHLIPEHLKTAADAAKHMPLLTDALLSGIAMRGAFDACADVHAATRVVDAMERRDSVRGTAAALSARAAAAGLDGAHSRDHDALVAQQSAPGGEAS